MARRLIERIPAQKVRLDFRRQLLDKARRTAGGNQLPDALDTNEVNHGLLTPIAARGAQCPWPAAIVGGSSTKIKTETCS